MNAGEYGLRRAPYAPISALQRFFDRIRDRQAPDLVDHTYLEKLNVASNNEYALLSALKFLGIVDDRGKPTHAYRLLQTTDRFELTLQHLVRTAYKALFDVGGESFSTDDLVNYFRVTSSASQAKNAARFFQAVCRLAALGSGEQITESPAEDAVEDQFATEQDPSTEVAVTIARAPLDPRQKPERELEKASALLMAKARLVEKLPAADPAWSAAEYASICEKFVLMFESLDRLQ